MAKFAGVEVTKQQIRGTITILRYYRTFLAQMEYNECLDPEGPRYAAKRMTREDAAERLGFLVNVAINRKAGIPDVPGRKHETDYQTRLARDCRAVRDIVTRRLRVYQFETAEVRERFGHLLARRDD